MRMSHKITRMQPKLHEYRLKITRIVHFASKNPIFSPYMRNAPEKYTKTHNYRTFAHIYPTFAHFYVQNEAYLPIFGKLVDFVYFFIYFYFFFF